MSPDNDTVGEELYDAEYVGDAEGADVLFLLCCISVTILGVSLLIARSALDLGVWSVIAGFVCLGVAGPFLFVFLGNHVAEPVDRLVYYFGYALPGIALVAIGSIVWQVIGLTTVGARKVWGVVIIFGLVWLASFLIGGAARFWWLRRIGYGAQWYDPHSGKPATEDADGAVMAYPGWTSYEWASLLVAFGGTAASIAAVVIEVTR